jgi:hypothetical protein
MPITVAEALATLDLELTSTVDEIDRRFRAMARTMHPDVGGTIEGMRRLTEARDIALDYAINRRVVVYQPASAPAQIVTGGGATPADRAFHRVIRVEVNRLRTLQRWSGALAAIGVAWVAVSSPFSPIAAELIPIVPSPIAILLAILGFVGVLLSLALQFSIASLRQAIQDLQDALRDRSTFVDLLRELNVDLAEPVTRDGLEHHARYWLGWRYSRRRHRFARPLLRDVLSGIGLASSSPRLQSVARRLDVGEFARLVLLQGVEIGLLRGRERVESGRLLTEYRLELPAEEAIGEP